MAVIPIVLIALGLAMDAFAVSITTGLALKEAKVNDALKMAVSFGLFQTIMPAVGWRIGISLRDFISGIDHWIAFGLLFLVGTKMIIDSFKREKRYGKLSYLAIIILSIATSIDALAIGISFSIINGAILMKALIIGFFSLTLSLIGLSIGKKLANFKFHYLGIIGGVVLIGLGIKVLFEHLG